MKLSNILPNNLSNWFIWFLFLYLTLIISLIYGENSTGGAVIDYINQKKVSIDFANSFKKTLLSYEEYSTRHSPILIIFLSIFEKFNLSDFVIRFLHMNLSLFLPIFFYFALKTKFKSENKAILFFISSLIFFSPTFRSLSVWPDSRLFGLTFFTLSIIYYLKFDQQNRIKYCYLNIIACAISSYISPNFAVFSLYFFYKYFLAYKNDYNKIFKIIILNFLLSVPALYYVFYLDIQFFAHEYTKENSRIFFDNIFNSILLTFSLIFFYLIPFWIFKVIKFELKFSLFNILITLFIFIPCLFFFNYQYSYSGGGIFFKLSYFLFQNNILFYIISLISIFVTINLLNGKFANYLIVFLLLINNPQISIYHKYFDPLLLIIFFTIFTLKIDLKKVLYNYNYLSIYLFFLCFLILNNLKFLWKI